MDLSRFKLTPDQMASLQLRSAQPWVPSRTSMDAPWFTAADRDANILKDAERFQRNNQSMANHKMLVNIGRLASIAPFGAAFAPGGAFAAGGAGAASGSAATGWTMPGVTAPTFGAGTSAAGAATSIAPAAAKVGTLSRLGSILGSRGVETGINAGLSLFGMKSQSNANKQARADALAAQAKEIELAEKQLALQTQNANLDREDARALNAAIQDLEKKKFALEQERLAFERGEYEKADQRLQPYRNVSEAALRRMSSILGL